MQWLVDLIIEAIGVPPTYINRGDHAGHDFNLGDFIQDGAFHDWDLSGIVPAGAVAVNLHITCTHANVSKVMYVRHRNYTNIAATCFIRIQVANITNTARRAVALDEDRHLEYMAQAPAWAQINASVKGWWL